MFSLLVGSFLLLFLFSYCFLPFFVFVSLIAIKNDGTLVQEILIPWSKVNVSLTKAMGVLYGLFGPSNVDT